MIPFPTDPKEFVAWLGSPAALGFMITLVLERWAWFQAKPPDVKKALVLLIAIGLVLLGAAGQMGLALVAIPTTFAGWMGWLLSLAMQGLIAWAATQYGHSADPARAKAQKQRALVRQDVGPGHSGSKLVRAAREREE